MLPEQRYKVIASQATNDWQVYDNLLLALICFNIPTQHQANRVRAAIIAAWYDGANAIKHGEVII